MRDPARPGPGGRDWRRTPGVRNGSRRTAADRRAAPGSRVGVSDRDGDAVRSDGRGGPSPHRCSPGGPMTLPAAPRPTQLGALLARCCAGAGHQPAPPGRAAVRLLRHAHGHPARDLPLGAGGADPERVLAGLARGRLDVPLEALARGRRAIRRCRSAVRRSARSRARAGSQVARPACSRPAASLTNRGQATASGYGHGREIPVDRADLRARVEKALAASSPPAGLLAEIDAALVPVADAIEAFVLGGGKRLRPAFAYWGYRGAGGRRRATRWSRAAGRAGVGPGQRADPRRPDGRARTPAAASRRCTGASPTCTGEPAGSGDPDGFGAGVGDPARRPVPGLVRRAAARQRARRRRRWPGPARSST